MLQNISIIFSIHFHYSLTMSDNGFEKCTKATEKHWNGTGSKWSKRSVIYMDESAFNLTKRSHIMDHRARADVPGQRGANTSLGAVISENGVLMVCWIFLSMEMESIWLPVTYTDDPCGCHGCSLCSMTSDAFGYWTRLYKILSILHRKRNYLLWCGSHKNIMRCRKTAR